MERNELTRRGFIGSTLGAAALGAISPLAESRRAVAADPAAGGGKPRLSACVEAVFNKGPFEQRIDEVKKVGLTAFEFWSWSGKDKDIEAIAKKKDELGLEVAAFSCNTGGALVAAGSKDKFVPALKESLAIAKKLACKRMIVTVGQEIQGTPREEQHKNIVEALKAGAPVAEEAGITLCLEPLNILVNHKGYYLSTSLEGFQIIDEVGSPNVRLLFDIYHQQITEGNVINNITHNLQKIGHFHVADVPGRHEPGTGEINYFNVFKAIAKTDYSAFVGLEMWPTGDHAQAVKDTMKIFDDALAAAAAEPKPAPSAPGAPKGERKGGKKKKA